MVIIQPETEKIVMIKDTKLKIWFLPKGRKDVGESLEQTALREAYEEVCNPALNSKLFLAFDAIVHELKSGYRAEFLPLYIPTRAPTSPNAQNDGYYEPPNTEPIYVSVITWSPRKKRSGTMDNGGEYLSFYYVGKIPVDAVSLGLVLRT